MSFKTFFSEQARNPSGIFGRLVMSKIFDMGNARLNRFMKEELELEENDHVLEIGFGSGKLIYQMSSLINKGWCPVLPRLSLPTAAMPMLVRAPREWKMQKPWPRRQQRLWG